MSVGAEKAEKELRNLFLSSTPLKSEFVKTDNALVMEMLVACVGAFVQHKILPQKESDELQAMMSSYQLLRNSDSNDGANYAPNALLFFYERGSHFLRFLHLISNYHHFNANLLKHTTRSYLEETSKEISEIILVLLEKSELFLSETIHLKQNQWIVQKTELSRYILSVSDELLNLKNELDLHIAESFRFHPFIGNRFDDTLLQASQTVSESLGFKEIDDSLSCAAISNQFITDFLVIGFDLADILSRALAVFKEKFRSAVSMQLNLYVHALRGDLERIKLLKLDSWIDQDITKDDIKTHLEFFRLEQVYQVQQFSSKLSEIKKMMAAHFSVSSLVKSTSQNTDSFVFDLPFHGALLFKLTSHNVTLSDAFKAVDQLRDYVKKHQCSLDSLIEAEVKKLSPHFSTEVIDWIKSHASEMPRDKRTVHQKTLMIRNALASITVLLCVLGCFTGCGLKTPPMSDEKTLRPEIPFHQAPTALNVDSRMEAKTETKNLKK